MSKTKTLYFHLLLCFCLVSSANTKLHKKLHHVQTKINSTKKALHTDKKKQAHLQKKLHDFAMSINQLENQLSDTHKKITQGQQKASEIKQHIATLNQQKSAQEKNLDRMIKRFYKTQRQEKNRLKNLLDHQASLKQTRMARYQNHLQSYIRKQLNQLKTTSEIIQATSLSLQKEMEKLTALRDQLILQQTLINQHTQQRKTILSSLNHKIKIELHTLTELKNNKRQLATLLKKLKQAKQSNAAYFTSHQHKMPWPAAGPITQQFGAPIEQSTLKSNGVTISAKDKTPVKAIAGGTVVFDEWMRGFGLLVIIDHGGGYMSIYGHNSTVLTKVGKQVIPGEIIANVGSSGGLANPELYFSIRHNGKPLDPSQWCS